eukprot:1167038-Pyramimonas_sp.AAC.1
MPPEHASKCQRRYTMGRRSERSDSMIMMTRLLMMRTMMMTMMIMMMLMVLTMRLVMVMVL